jgi:exopolyphosphatase/guanosine-5'-triphosphate,3'-diphosphate pyrophosphatase
MRIAIIDLGTNTFNILIVEIEGKERKHIFQTKLPVKLGEGGINDRIIQPVPFQRGLAALKEHQRTIEKYNVHTVYAFATSAIRDAVNGKEFVAEVKKETGFDVQIISGDKEAELIYLGVMDAVKMTEDLSLIIDIGGGSTEFIIANKHGIKWKHSFQLGAARLLERFNPSDPIREQEITALWDHLEKELVPLSNALEKFPVTELIGSSGSFDSLAEMIAWKYYTPDILDNITEYEFNMSDCAEMYKLILRSTKAERMEMKGLVEMRVDMIVISSIIVYYVLSMYGIQRMRLSTYALKEGVLHELVK